MFLCAAVKMKKDGKMFVGNGHSEAFRAAFETGNYPEYKNAGFMRADNEQGFLVRSAAGVSFLDRRKAFEAAKATANLINDNGSGMLQSEDVRFIANGLKDGQAFANKHNSSLTKRPAPPIR